MGVDNLKRFKDSKDPFERNTKHTWYDDAGIKHITDYEAYYKHQCKPIKEVE